MHAGMILDHILVNAMLAICSIAINTAALVRKEAVIQ